jgi:hypothetical protein
MLGKIKNKFDGLFFCGRCLLSQKKFRCLKLNLEILFQVCGLNFHKLTKEVQVQQQKLKNICRRSVPINPMQNNQELHNEIL